MVELRYLKVTTKTAAALVFTRSTLHSSACPNQPHQSVPVPYLTLLSLSVQVSAVYSALHYYQRSAPLCFAFLSVSCTAHRQHCMSHETPLPSYHSSFLQSSQKLPFLSSSFPFPFSGRITSPSPCSLDVCFGMANALSLSCAPLQPPSHTRDLLL